MYNLGLSIYKITFLHYQSLNKFSSVEVITANKIYNVQTNIAFPHHRKPLPFFPLNPYRIFNNLSGKASIYSMLNEYRKVLSITFHF